MFYGKDVPDHLAVQHSHIIGGQSASTKSSSTSEKSNQVQPPAITLPKGGGAIRGIGEKFAANPVTGTGSMTVPIATSLGRNGFGPQLVLSYDSGADNSTVGFGWNLSLPSITRKTDKGLPQYRDSDESDVFILSGAEDLVPLLNEDDSRYVDDSTEPAFVIYRYRPRIEGLFARIECWVRKNDGAMHWRSISKDNILTIYGKDTNSRIADPQNPLHIFSWLICETRDDKGNAIIYEYKADDDSGVDFSQLNERNRVHRATNRYVKRVRYGNRQPLLEDRKRPHFLADDVKDWLFEVVFDYGEHDSAEPTPQESTTWDFRTDPFSTYRSGFEIRTTRLCQRVLMFHHFPDEANVSVDCLVRSTDFSYFDHGDAKNRIYTFLKSVTQTGYERDGAGGYLSQSMPPVEFEYTLPLIHDKVQEVDARLLENAPIGLDSVHYQWTDLHGEGIQGLLTEQAGAWYYKPNHSPLTEKQVAGKSETSVKFAPLEVVANRPNTALASSQFMDLAGDGSPDLVMFDGALAGFYEHDGQSSWKPFQPFVSRVNRSLSDPNLRLVDLNGDGHADMLVTEGDRFVWHPSLGEAGFGGMLTVPHGFDEEQGPHLIFADSEQAIYLSDMSGDRLTDLVRIRNGEVCYWPNLGFGRFGPKIAMDGSPHFDNPDQFDQRRIRLADIDGSGTTDIIYLHRDGVRLYFNQSGNSWSLPQQLNAFPQIDDLASIRPVDLLGNGTACLVWSSALPSDRAKPLRYVNLMGGQKPHLLVKSCNNLGAETHIQYTPSTKFYLQDKQAGKPWVTRLAFPVHVVERVETYDRISHNRFVTRYAYHHGYFDGAEREFRGFGMVEQWDAETIAALRDGANIDAASHLPPTHTKTWFHTGAYFDSDRLSSQFESEYFNADNLPFLATLLPDTVLDAQLTTAERVEASRALKGMMLRQEVYADDGSDIAHLPFTVVEQNFTIRLLQAREANRHAVFFAHPREAITYHYERRIDDPRIQHALTLAVDDFGNVLRQIAVGYGRRQADGTLPTAQDQNKQTQILATYTENRVTPSVDDNLGNYRTPLPYEARTYELTDIVLEDGAERLAFDQWTDNEFALVESAPKRLIEHARTLYRKDDLSALLPLGAVEAMALPGESHQLAFTAEILVQTYIRAGQNLLPDLAAVLGDEGGYVVSADLKNDGLFPNEDPDNQWWIPSGCLYFSPDEADAAQDELAHAQQHFFLPYRYCDPFGETTTVAYDKYDLLLVETVDAVGNRMTVGERDSDGVLTVAGNDYRLLQASRIMDANRNRTQVVFNTLGMVVGTAVMGKPEENLGDSLDNFAANLSLEQIRTHLNDLLASPHTILQKATSRLLYDLFAYHDSKDLAQPHPVTVYTLVRETHSATLVDGQKSKLQHSFSYSDGFGREVQQKIQAEPDKDTGAPRWVGSGWTVFDNKGNPVRQYEPFFTNTHHFEFGLALGVSPVLFYDPLQRVIATLHPNHTYEKVLFTPWEHTTYDVNDTVLNDPRTDDDVKGYVKDYLATQPADWQTWHVQRKDGDLGDHKQQAATKAAEHANTPSTAYLDTLGRPFLTVAHNKVACANHALDGTEDHFYTRSELDIEGNQLIVRDAITIAVDENGVETADLLGRIVMIYAYDMLGNRIFQRSMEAGARWTLNDIVGNPIRAWDDRQHTFRTKYDVLRRPVRTFVLGANQDNRSLELLTERIVYGEQHPDAIARNLRGVPYLQLDQAGVVRNEENDFKGNLLRSSRQVAIVYKTVVDWGAVANDTVALPPEPSQQIDLVALENALSAHVEEDVYTSLTRYDALNRPIQQIAPHNQSATKRDIVQHRYNEANLLEGVDVWLERQSEPASLLDSATVPTSPVGVNNIDYDAKGQRLRIEYKNGVTTHYDYDPTTFRLKQLYTRRDTTFNDCGENEPFFPAPNQLTNKKSCGVQNLHYTYDPVGNITHIQDDAQQAIFFRNQLVTASNDYVYDALYRLIKATGREHLGMAGGTPIPHSYDDSARMIQAKFPHQNDPTAMGRYTEWYVYDGVGNFTEMKHVGSDAAGSRWTRTYLYEEDSLIEDGANGTLRKVSNRLSRTVIGVNDIPTNNEPYAYDAHGNMNQMQHLTLMQWDYRDQLQATAKGIINGGQPETTYCVYDTSGQRFRKTTTHALSADQVLAGEEPTRKHERIYLGGFEIYREFDATGATITLERETLHVTDDTQRIALIETRTQGDNDPAPRQLIRYQFSNHLGSATLELDPQAQIISYEEYAPYGSITYQAMNSQITPQAKRYRYSGMERDEENGMNYHAARYYLTWLGNWISIDPAFIEYGVNLYFYSFNNPVKYKDNSGLRPLPGSATLHEDEGVLQKEQEIEEFRNRDWGEPHKMGEVEKFIFQVAPITGNIDGLHTAWTGQDIDGNKVGTGGRVFAAITAIPGLGNVLKLIKTGNKARKTTKIVRSVTKNSGEIAETIKQKGSRLAEIAKKGLSRRATLSASETLVGTAGGTFRKKAAKIIRDNPEHPLKKLLDSSGKLKNAVGKKHHELIDDPSLLEMGHVISKKSGDPEVLVLQSAWLNQFDRLTVEGIRRADSHVRNVAISIGGIGVELRTAADWVKAELLDKTVFDNAPKIIFP